MNTAPLSNASPQHAVDSAGMDESRLSALVDGELAADELKLLFLECGDSTDLQATWTRYQFIGASLRGSDVVPGLQSPQAFLAGVHAGLHGSDGKTVKAQGASPLPLGSTRVGAGTALAANDPVFRWKMVAGLASLAAVMAVSWTVLSSSQAGPGGGAQLALVDSVPVQGKTPTLAAASVTGSASQAVVVNTDQGPLIRDARLEALMAEHRHGGVSALQMPAGFLRNATYDDAGR